MTLENASKLLREETLMTPQEIAVATLIRHLLMRIETLATAVLVLSDESRAASEAAGRKAA
jgi:hypothetical protein